MGSFGIFTRFPILPSRDPGTLRIVSDAQIIFSYYIQTN